MIRMNVYISYILCGALVFASPASYSLATNSGTTGGANATSPLCSNTDPTGGVQVATNSPLASSTSGNVSDARPGEGQTQACTTIEGVESYLNANYSTFQASGLKGDNYTKIKAGYEKYKKARKSCLEGHATAANLCMESASPDLAKGAADVNNVLAQMTSGANGSCDGASKAMEMAKNALTAFTGACGGAKKNCTSQCGSASTGANELLNEAKKGIQEANCTGSTDPSCEANRQNYTNALEQGIAAATQEANSSELTSVAGKNENCGKNMDAMLGSAMQGIMGMLAGMMQGNKCEEETSGEAEEQNTATADKCIKVENASLPECICLANPRTPGCSNSYEKSGQSSGSQIGTGLTDKANVDSGSPMNIGGTDRNTMEQAERSGGDSGLPGAPAGGGPGIGSAGGGGSGPGAPEGTGGPRKGLNANIFGGAGGGGGSGGFRGAASTGEGEANKYRQYLPGGEKDPSKGMAGQSTNREITGQGGKSNFEKIRERYLDNRNSLLNN